MRLTLLDVRSSRLPQVIGACAADTHRILSYLNEAQQRLLMDKNCPPEGWWGTFARMAFTVSADHYIVTPRNVARIQDLAVCNSPIRIQNEFYEWLEGGGLYGETCTNCVEPCGTLQAFDRGMTPVAVPLSADATLRVYSADSRDEAEGSRILIKGLDANGVVVRSTDGTGDVNGEFMDLTYPFQDGTTVWTTITGIVKDETYGDVRLYSVDPTTGDETLIGFYEPSQTMGVFRRYYVNNMPSDCCGSNQTPTLVTGMVKLDYVPAQTDSDILTISNIPALILECESLRYSEMDSPNALQMSAMKHDQAIQQLVGEFDHYVGRRNTAISINPFGTATLNKRSIGALI